MKTPVALALLAVVAVGCASNKPAAPVTPQAAIPSIPDWYTNLPKDQNYFYGRGTAQSREQHGGRPPGQFKHLQPHHKRF
jgi:hypothetical protein